MATIQASFSLRRRLARRYLFMPAAGLAGGCTAGIIIEHARSALLATKRAR